jgi:hypothetical protein
MDDHDEYFPVSRESERERANGWNSEMDFVARSFPMIGRMHDPFGIHAKMTSGKLTVSRPEDPAEVQADAIANSVMNDDVNASQNLMQAPHSDLSATTENAFSSTPPGFEEKLERLKGGGVPLEDEQQEKLEKHLDADIDSVRLHTGEEAKALSESIGARAFAVGQDIFFKDEVSDELLAHEVVHTVQHEQNKIQTSLFRYIEPVHPAEKWFSGFEKYEPPKTGYRTSQSTYIYPDNVAENLMDAADVSNGDKLTLLWGNDEWYYVHDLTSVLIGYIKKEFVIQETATNLGIENSTGLTVSYTLPTDVQEGDPDRIALRAAIEKAYFIISSENVIKISQQLVWTNTYPKRNAGETRQTTFQTKDWITGLKLMYEDKPHVLRIVEKYTDEVLMIGRAGIKKLDYFTLLASNLTEYEFDLYEKENPLPKNILQQPLHAMYEFVRNKSTYFRSEDRIEAYLKTFSQERETNFQNTKQKLFDLNMSVADYNKLSKTADTGLLNKYGFSTHADFLALVDTFKKSFLDKLAGETFTLLDRNEKLVTTEKNRYQAKDADLNELASMLINGKLEKRYSVADEKRYVVYKQFFDDFDIQPYDIPGKFARMQFLYANVMKSKADGIAFFKGATSDELTNFQKFMNGFFGQSSTGNPDKTKRFYKGLEKKKSIDPNLYDRLIEDYQPYKGIGDRVLSADLGKEFINAYYPAIQDAWELDRAATTADSDLIQKHPFLADVTVNFRDLSREYNQIARTHGVGTSQTQLKERILELLSTKLDNIKTVREDTTEDISKVWTYETIRQHVMEKESIDKDDIMGTMITEEVKTEEDNQFWWSIGLAAVGVVIGILGVLTLQPEIVALGLGIGAYQVYEQLDIYTSQKALSNTGFDEQLSRIDPPLWPVVLSIVGFVAFDIGPTISILSGIARGTAALERALPSIYKNLTKNAAPESELVKMGYKGFKQTMLEAYNTGFDAGKNSPAFQKLLADYASTVSLMPRYGKTVLFKIFEKDPQLAEILVKSCVANPKAISELSLQALANPKLLASYNQLVADLPSEAGTVFRFLGTAGKKYLPQLDQGIAYLPKGIGEKNQSFLLRSENYWANLASNTAKLADQTIIDAATRLGAGLNNATPEILDSIKRILVNGISEADLKIILAHAENLIPQKDRLYTLQRFLQSLDTAGNLKVKNYSLVVNMLKSGGQDFDKVMRTLTYTQYKGKWDKFEGIFNAKVFGKVANPPQGYTVSSFKMLNDLILSMTSQFGGKIRAQGSRLMNASDVDDAGRFTSDLDYTCMVDEAGFTNALRLSFGEDLKGGYKLLFPNENIVGEMSTEQFTKFFKAAKEDFNLAAGKRVLKGDNRKYVKELFEADEKNIIYQRNLKTNTGKSMNDFIESIKTTFGDIDFSVKRADGFEDPPYININ